MHPLLYNPRRLGLYLLAWLPVGGLVAYLLAAAAGIPLAAAWALGVPMALLYALLSLPVWVTCRVLPVQSTPLGRLFAGHAAAAVTLAALWIAAFQLSSLALGQHPGWHGLDRRLHPVLPLVAATGLLLYLLVAAGDSLALALAAWRTAEARLLQAGLLARDAELRALKAQVNPHFLFNSLNSVSALTATDPARAREMCVLLGDFLRRTLGMGEKPAIPLAEELALVHAFLAVELVRFDGRIQMHEVIAPEALALPLPPLLLQPLVENAVVHGIAHLVEGGTIDLEVRRGADAWHIVVENSFDPEAPGRRTYGVGLANVRERLAARYDGRARFEAGPVAGRFRAAITLPIEAAP